MTAEPLFTKPVFTVLDDLLDLVEVLHADDPLVRVGDVVGRDGALVLDLLLRDEVWCVDFLEKQVAFVFLVHQHLLDDISAPFSPTKLGLDVLAFQVVLDVRVGAAFQKHLEYPYIKENLEKKKQSVTRDLWLHNRDSLSVWCFMEMCSYDSFIKLFIHYFEKDPPGKPDDLDGLSECLFPPNFSEMPRLITIAC